VPYYRQLYRFWLFWRSAESLRPIAEVDPAWPHQERSVSELNDMMRELLTEALTAQYTDRPDLLDKVLPGLPAGCQADRRRQRRVRAGAAPRQRRADDDGIARITPQGVETVDGTLHELDVIIYATGFQSTRFLTPMKVVGRGGSTSTTGGTATRGVPRHDRARASRTSSCCTGRTRTSSSTGSIIWFSECEVRYVMDCIRTLLAEATPPST
jgi:4-hydroxyacetophenone monooxygenase